MLDVVEIHARAGHWLDHLRSPLLLFTRWWVGWQFLKSGWLKLGQWDTTLELFRSEYRVPWLSPELAAIAGTVGELLFPLLVISGFLTRVGALGLSAVNLLAVASYWHVLGAEGYEAALAQHVLWGFMLLVLVTCGAGAASVDRMLAARRRAG